MNAANDDVFWRWCGRRYEDPELRRLLLQAQDRHELVVLELMFAAWLAELGAPYSPEHRRQIRGVIDPWYRDVIVPLRQRRKDWRADSDLDPLRRRLGELELNAEQHLAQLLIAAYGAVEGSSEPGLLAANVDIAAGPKDVGPAVVRPIVERFAALQTSAL